MERIKDQIMMKPKKETQLDFTIKNNMFRILNKLGNKIIEEISIVDKFCRFGYAEKWESNVEIPNLEEVVISERNLIYLAEIVSKLLPKEKPKQMKWRGDEEITIRNDMKEQPNDTILNELSQLTKITNYFTTIEANQTIIRTKPTNAIDTDNIFRLKPIYLTQLWIFLESLKPKCCSNKRKKKKRRDNNNIYSGEE
jgi:hypothetical protein